MASSSSSATSPQSQKKYDVFVSFRGEDTRSNFTSHLYDALDRKGVDTYIDYRLEKGDRLWPALEKAIEDSTLFLVIFSENYASSTWCLKELAKILECSKDQGRKGQLVIPVFYKVDPSHVKKQLGSYQTAFAKHGRNININKQQLLQWREALTHASNLAGWDSSNFRNEVELIGEIIKCVVRKLDSTYQGDGNLNKWIGIHAKIADIESLLYKGSSQDIQFIGIWGMGGIGKTTLARAIYDKLCSQYEGCCFLNNVREESKKYGIAALGKRLISTLLGDQESHGIYEEITPFDIRRLSRKRSLIVLDDVDDHEHLETLAERHDWFGTGSKILITARNKQVLSRVVDVYEVKPLNFREAFCLFSLNAFKCDSVDQKFRGLAKNVISYANGIPLALKVLGTFLYGKSHQEWESQLEKLKKISPSKIHDVLKLSFEGLDYEEKNIFLDVACIFKCCDIDYVKNLLDACGYSTTIGLKSLEDKALLNIHGKKIIMHDLIQEMGREIIREESREDPKRRSRLWNSSEIFQILKDNVGTEAIEAMTLNVSEIEEISLSPQAFCSMPNLRFLDFHYDFNYEKGEKVNRLQCYDGLEFLPNKLRLLHWEGYPLNYLPATFKVENLVTIKMRKSRLRKLWDGCQNLVNLRKIDLSRSKNLIELPNFSKAIHLKHVDISYCSKLQSVHSSILSLHSLKSLRLYQCRALTSLTSHTHLKSLSQLNLSGCSKLRKFSVTSDCCQFQLELSRTTINVDELFSSSEHLSKIDRLAIDRVGGGVTNLPYKWADLRNLRVLIIGGYDKLDLKLCFIFDELRALEHLSLHDCSDLFELPDNICLLSSLYTLSLSRSNVETLPVSIKHLRRLSTLQVDRCKRLRYLPELPPSIVDLDASNCTSLETLHITPMTAVTWEAKRGLWRWYFNFADCMKLDQQSIQAVEAEALLMINNGFNSVKFIYPGNKVPEWFMYMTVQSSMTLDLFSIPQPSDGSFIFCTIVSESSCITERTCIEIEWFIDGLYVDKARALFNSTRSDTCSDNVFLWYDARLSSHIQSIIQTYDQSSSYHPLLEIKFSIALETWRSYRDSDDNYDSDYEEAIAGKIIGCGVCPTYAPQYQNYIKQIQSALQPQLDCVGTGADYSYYNTHHKEAVPGRSKALIFPTPPAGAWRNPTQGLKDVISQ